MDKKRQSIDSNIKMNQFLEWSVKDFIVSIIKLFQQEIVNSLETNEKNFPVGPVAKTPYSQLQGPGLDRCSGI